MPFKWFVWWHSYSTKGRDLSTTKWMWKFGRTHWTATVEIRTQLCWDGDEWKTEQLNKWTNEQMNKWTNEQINELSGCEMMRKIWSIGGDAYAPETLLTSHCERRRSSKDQAESEITAITSSCKSHIKQRREKRVEWLKSGWKVVEKWWLSDVWTCRLTHLKLCSPIWKDQVEQRIRPDRQLFSWFTWFTWLRCSNDAGNEVLVVEAQVERGRRPLQS